VHYGKKGKKSQNRATEGIPWSEEKCFSKWIALSSTLMTLSDQSCRAKRPRSPRVSGFTLIELLAVIAILGVLAALITGSLSKVRAKASQANCAANLRQIGTAMATYTAENNGFFPPHWGSDNRADWAWYGFVAPYITEWNGDLTAPMSKVFHCPANPRPYNPTQNYQSLASNVDQSYGFNLNLSSNFQMYSPYRKQTLAKQSKLVVVTDIPALGTTTDQVTSPNAQFYPVDGRVSKRHAGSANFLFVDGHVESRNTKDFLGADFDIENWVPTTE
jgi:prepilin-type processing-associated H-X9-DG protein/prepilin-type N-terminal cleavage/methylation domain-containing protein